MTAAKHTPGPWWVTDSGVRDRGGYICHTNKPTHYEGQDERYESETAERAANAIAIAAVPEMLEAAKALHKLLDRDAVINGSDIVLPCETHDQAWNYLHEARGLLKAVIAQATGAAP